VISQHSFSFLLFLTSHFFYCCFSFSCFSLLLFLTSHFQARKLANAGPPIHMVFSVDSGKRYEWLSLAFQFWWKRTQNWKTKGSRFTRLLSTAGAKPDKLMVGIFLFFFFFFFFFFFSSLGSDSYFCSSSSRRVCERSLSSLQQDCRCEKLDRSRIQQLTCKSNYRNYGCRHCVARRFVVSCCRCCKRKSEHSKHNVLVVVCLNLNLFECF
jgi:hypothetical protein